AFVCGLAGEGLRGGALRGQSFAVLFLLALVLPLAQLVPLPTAARRLIDPAGAALLENAPGGLPAVWPASLDPQSTAEEVATAAAALAVFLLALNVSARRRYRRAPIQAVAFAGIAAVVSGLIHKIFGIERLYGFIDVNAAVLPGPFINPNHCAELFELAAFASLALAMTAEAEARIAWYLAAGTNGAAALATLSRGSMLALFAGGVTFVVLRWAADRAAQSDPAAPATSSPVGRAIGWTVGAILCLVSVAVAFGATPVIDELQQTHFASGSEKTALWKDAWSVVLHHPLGIGRHAFDRVFPAYKTLAVSSRFEFVENAPLEALIDVGWPGLLALGIASAWLVRKVVATWRSDYVAAALAAALAALAVHNLVDFGLETMGIRLPFAAIAGVMIGRAIARADEERRASSDAGRLGRFGVAATVFLGLGVAFVGQARTSAVDLERQWHGAPAGEVRLALAIEGGRRYPTDYYFPLLESYDQPLRPHRSGLPSPRLGALNRALRLCPGCGDVHQEAGRALLGLGRRAQALSSFQDAVRIQPQWILRVLNELDADRFTPTELASLAVGDGAEIMAVARFLVPKGAPAERAVLATVAEAGNKGVPPTELLLVKADLATTLGRFEPARALLTEAAALSPHDARIEAARAHAYEREGRLGEALEHARRAVLISPFDVELARHRLQLVMALQRWSELDGALEQLKTALRQGGNNVTEVHLAASEAHAARGNLARAVLELKTAATLDARNPAIWAAVARTSEAEGDLTGAGAAYRQVIALKPGDAEATASLARLERAKADARLQQMLIPGH
ncbi:MAG TPA: O-antigen ligase family protein, partial [Polyangia bacterium]